MEAWFKGIAAFLAGGLTLVWHPGLESTQNLVTSYLQLSGQVVAPIWLTLIFAWAFLAASIGYAVSTFLHSYFVSRSEAAAHVISLQTNDGDES